MDTQWPSSLRILPYPWTSFLSPLYALVKALMFPFCCCSRFRLYCWQFSITIATPPIIFTSPIESPLILLIMFLPYYINSVIVIFLRLLPLLLSLPLSLLIHDDVPLTYPVPIFSVFPPTITFYKILTFVHWNIITIATPLGDYSSHCYWAHDDKNRNYPPPPPYPLLEIRRALMAWEGEEEGLVSHKIPTDPVQDMESNT